MKNLYKIIIILLVIGRVSFCLAQDNKIDELLALVLKGDLASVKKIITVNPSILKQRDKYGFAILHEVAGEEKYEIAEYMISQGADVNAKNDEGLTALHLAAYPKMAEVLLKHGANIEEADNEGNTPLITHASEEEHTDVMKFLLKNGANINAKNLQGQTALDIAKEREDADKISILKKFVK